MSSTKCRTITGIGVNSVSVVLVNIRFEFMTFAEFVAQRKQETLGSLSVASGTWETKKQFLLRFVKIHIS